MDQNNTQTQEMKPKKNFARPKRIEWIKKNNRRLRFLRGTIVFFCGMLLVIGAILLIRVLEKKRA